MTQTPVAAGGNSPHAYFIISKLVPSSTRPGRTEKMPCDKRGNVVSLHVADRMTQEQAHAEAMQLGDNYRPAVILTGDGRFCIDIDDALQSDNTWSSLGNELCQTFAGCYVEVSQSGRGLHIFGRTTSIPDHAKKNIPLHIELYTDDRFICLGQSGSGDMEFNASGALNATVARYFPQTEQMTGAEWTTTHHESAYPIEDDAKLVTKAMSGKQGAAAIFGGKATFKDLWSANVELLTESYPDPVRGYDASSADAALAQHLMFWTGGNCERTERLMRLSSLKRDKWDTHKSYIQRTVLGAAARQTSYYSVGAPIALVTPAQVVEAANPVARSGFQFLGTGQLMDHFKGCVYVAHDHKILTPNGSLLKSEQFNAMYGGYVMTLDDSNEKTTKKAWEAFTENQGVMFPKVDRSIFKPDLAPGAIIEEDGLRKVNTYVPVEIPSVKGDVSPFLMHLQKLLPNDNDRQILLSYMAACVQHKGVKFKWAPLIQGVEGNGKTLFTMVVMKAVGKRYSHMPPANEIGEKFNEWLFDKIFIGVEDIYVPEQKMELIEVLKPMITGEELTMRAMQKGQEMRNLCANFIFNSNHRNAVKKTSNDRRFCVFFTAQQEKSDLKRDGMTGNYFPELYDWLKVDGGFAAVTHYLENYTIPVGYNPAIDCQRAPDTSTMGEAITASLGGVEQEVMEAIDEGRQGFAGGWVSSFALDKLIERLRAERQIPRAKRRDLMRSLGYDWHPALRDGRVNNVIMIDGGKPRLFIKEGHPHVALQTAAEVVNCYCAAQGDVSAAALLRTAQ